MIFHKSNENGMLPPDMTNFGASLKKARESKGVSLDQIAAETRISTRFLTAIVWLKPVFLSEVMFVL